MQRTAIVARQFQNQVDFFLDLTTDHGRTLHWLRNNGLLPAQRTCCNQVCSICRKSDSIDGQMFRCIRCKAKYNIRDNTRWEKFRRTPFLLLVRLVFYYFPNGYSARRAYDAVRMINVGISYATMKRIYSEVREVIANYMLLEIYNTPLRGRIQIDEALFTHRAGPGRRGLRQVWVVGMIEERSSEVFCFVVPTRNARVINGLITTHCLFGSYIIHDGWGGYSRIPNTYTHHRYRHHINDPDNTSRIEGVWGELRAFMRNIYSGGVVETNVRSLIQELVFRRRCRERNLVFIDELVYALNNY